MKFAVLVTCAITALLLVALSGMWVPSAIMSRDALITAREDQLRSSVKLVAPKITAMMQEGTEGTLYMERLWNITMARNNTQPMTAVYNEFRESLWAYAAGRPEFGALTYLSPAHPDLLNGTERGRCLPLHRFDFFFIGEYFAGLNWEPGIFVKGPRDWSDPTGELFQGLQPVPCSDDRAGSYSYETTPTWRDVLYVSISINVTFRLVTRPIVDPPHVVDPYSMALVTYAVAVGDEHPATADGIRTATHTLRDAASETELRTTYLLIDKNGKLIASSDQNSQIYDSDGLLIGIPTVNNETAIVEPGLTIGKSLFENSCRTGSCNFSVIPEIHYVDGYTVAATELIDDQAANLDLMLLCVVKTADVIESATELNIRLAIVGGAILILAVTMAIVFGIKTAQPIADFSGFMELAANMQRLEEIRDMPTRTSIVSEIVDMRVSLQILVRKLMEYRSYLPSAMFQSQDSDRPSDSCKGSSKPSTRSDTSNPNGSNFKRKTSSFTASSGELGANTNCSMASKNVTIMTSYIEDFHLAVTESRCERVTHEFTNFISLFTDSLTNSRGTLDRFIGDQVQLSWNSSTLTVSGHAGAALRTACQVRDRYLNAQFVVFSGELGIGVTSGKSVCGNAGNTSARAFNVCGIPSLMSLAIAKVAARSCGISILCGRRTFAEAGTQFDSLPLGNFHTRIVPVSQLHHVYSLAAIADTEWMYVLSNAFGVKGLLEALEQENWEILQTDFMELYLEALKQKLPLTSTRLETLTDMVGGEDWVQKAFTFTIDV
eukprot:TRINITY_DN271_c1_g1_i1.p1 TRINITY_DN271_c1_g1~~TRINITY_DN271_c1_g1_i1.p1  ORF type:complete len:776 (+),score=119.25 TRINITY_DN271_c1_g1_i1:80-2407(+)